MPVRGRESGLTSIDDSHTGAEYPARMAVNVGARSGALPRLDWLTGYGELLRTLLRSARSASATRALPSGCSGRSSTRS